MKIPANIIERFTRKKILILGLGREGRSSYQLLRSIVPDQTLLLADQQPFPKLATETKHIIDQDDQLKLFLGSDYLQAIEQADIIFRTPGIPLHLPQLQQAQQAGAALTSNLQLFLEITTAAKQQSEPLELGFNSYQSQLPEPLVIGVTGTKGKSTTAALIHHVIANQYQAELIGNIGRPALNCLDRISSQTKIVIEMSAQQLQQLKISPDIAVIQQVTSEHLDYYPHQSAYFAAKEPITKYQKVNQYVITNQNWPQSAKIAQLSPGKKFYFQIQNQTSTDKTDILVYLKSHCLTFSHNNAEEPILHKDDSPLPGKHNLTNMAPAIIIGKLLQLSTSQIQAALKTFQPLPHRLEQVAVKNGITYVNDSLGTMPRAAISALSCFEDQSIILLAGGHERQQDFGPLAEQIVHSDVKAIALFPANGLRLWQEIEHKQAQLNLNKDIAHRLVNSMDKAMNFAQQHAQADDVILLSPGAASFGVFDNYADRGQQFRDWVQQLPAED